MILRYINALFPYIENNGMYQSNSGEEFKLSLHFEGDMGNKYYSSETDMMGLKNSNT